jgi:hypothetical protein
MKWKISMVLIQFCAINSTLVYPIKGSRSIAVKSMQVWLVCLLLFFGAAELYQWVQSITLPMPVFMIAGALLAVASNLNKFSTKAPLPSSATQPKPMSPDVPPASTPLPSSPQKQISFTIRKPQSEINRKMGEQAPSRES